MSSEKTQKDAKQVAKKHNEIGAKDGYMGASISNDETGFGAQYSKRGEQERTLKIKQDYVAWLNKKDVQGRVGDLRASYVPTPEDIEVLLQKNDEQELYNFENFLASRFNMDDPTHQAIINEVYPQFYDRRIEEIDRVADLQKRLAKIKLLGAHSKEDFYFLYALDNGAIKVPNEAVFNTGQWGRVQAFERGLLNTKRWAAAGGKNMRKATADNASLIGVSGGFSPGFGVNWGTGTGGWASTISKLGSRNNPPGTVP